MNTLSTHTSAAVVTTTPGVITKIEGNVIVIGGAVYLNLVDETKEIYVGDDAALAVGQSVVYKTGTDIYRFATNEGVNGKLSPEKRYIRCETVDFQMGEVEWRGGNLPMQKWNSNLNIDKFEPIK